MVARKLEGRVANGHFSDRLLLQRGFLKNRIVLFLRCSLLGQGRPGRTREDQGKCVLFFRLLFFAFYICCVGRGRLGKTRKARDFVFVFLFDVFVGQGIPGSPSESREVAGSPKDSLGVPGNPWKPLSQDSCHLSEK